MGHNEWLYTESKVQEGCEENKVSSLGSWENDGIADRDWESRWKIQPWKDDVLTITSSLEAQGVSAKYSCVNMRREVGHMGPWCKKQVFKNHLYKK